MGNVYRAHHSMLKRDVTLKVLPPERMRDAAAVTRFRREIEMIGRLDYPNLTRASDADEAEGLHFLVMGFLESMDGSQLAMHIAPLPTADACEIVRQAALGLQHAHEHGVVTRDIKPSNLMITHSSVVRVLDLGRARLRETLALEIDLAMPDQILGTVDSMAPEPAQAGPPVDIRAISQFGLRALSSAGGRAMGQRTASED